MTVSGRPFTFFLIIAVVFPLLMMISGISACAQSAAPAAIEIRQEGSAAFVYVNGAAVVGLRSTNANLDPLQRAAIVADRIRTLASQGQPLAKLTVKSGPGDAAVMWGEQVVVYATAAEAAAQSSTPGALARTWLSQLKKQLSLPPVKFQTGGVTVPVGENRNVPFAGSSSGPFSVRMDPPTLADVRIDGNRVVVFGKQNGRGFLEVTAPEGTDRVPVEIARYAGQIRQAGLTAQVTGRNVPGNVVAEAAWRAARSACVLEPGAFAVVSLAGNPRQLGPDTVSLDIPVNIKMDGAGFLTRKVTTNVRVERAHIAPLATGMLLYSNHPEQVKVPQPLYLAPLLPDESCRLLYHHQNGTGQNLQISILLANTSDKWGKVHLIGALADPIQDTVLVGYRAGAQFLKDRTSQVGYVVDVPPQSRIMLWTGTLKRMDTASGIVEMRQVDGESNIVVRVISEPATVARNLQEVAPVEIGDRTMAHSDHQYPTPVRKLAETYVAGERWLFIRVGKHAVADQGEGKVLYGNYGVLYDIDLTLENPTPESKVFQVMFDPTAGIAGVATMIDGQFVGKSHHVGSRELPLASYTLSPGERRQVHFSTVPLAGSNYPATIVVRS